MPTVIFKLLENFGKWENLIKTGVELLSGMGLIQSNQPMIQDYPSGSGRYGVDVNIEKSIRVESCLWAFFYFKSEEKQKRQVQRLSMTPTISEVKNKLINIQKWIAFQDVLISIKKNWESNFGT